MRRCFLFLTCLLSFYVLFGQSIIPAGPVGICQGNNATLTVTGVNGAASYVWETSTDGGVTWNVITGQTSFTLVVSTTGKFRARVNGTQTTNEVDVTLSPNPVADFVFSPGGECGNVPVSFTDGSSGNGLSYSWNFGDANSGANNASAIQNPVHRFVGTPGTSTQTFTVALTVTSSDGCTAQKQKPITTKQLPGTQLNGTGKTVYFDKPYFVQCVTTASLFTFTNASSTAASNSSYKIIWGDNSPDFTATAFSSTNHTYGVGTYTLAFIVNGSNCSDTGIYYVFVGGNPTGGMSSPGGTLGCTGSSFSFPFENVSGNPPGTEYYVSVDDNPTDTFRFTQATLPAFFTHVFNKSSCDYSPSKTFTVTYLFRNPCGETPGSIGGIRISKKATAAFSISPKDTVCQNTVVTFTNTGTSGSTMPAVGATCIPGNSIWDVSPATGWTRTSGSFGTDNGFPLDGDAWTSGSAFIGINFTAPGTYTIKLKSGTARNTTNKCGIDSIVKTICVNPTPTGSFTLDKLTGCASPSLIVNGTATTNTPFCGANKFSWRVSYAPTSGCLPAVKNFTYINGTDSTSAQPVFQFNAPGIYTVGLVVYGPASTCSTTIASQQIIVKGLPNVSFTLPASVCQNASLTHTEAATCYMAGPPAPAYSWTLTGGTVSSPNTLNPGTIVFNTAGTQTITLTATNECGATSLPQNIAVNPVPDVAVPSNIVACPGTTVGPLTFSSSLPGVSFSWTNSNAAIGLASSGTGATINSFTATNATANAVTATVTVTATRNGCSASQTFSITVNPSPAVTQPANQSVCNGASTTLISFGGTGTTYSWTNNNTGIGLAASGTGDIAPFQAINTGTSPVVAAITVIPKTNNGVACNGPSKTFTISVNPSPSITAAAANPTSCGSATGKIVINGLTAGSSYSVTYTKNGTAVSPSTQTAAAGGTVTISNLTAGIYDNITVALSGCASNAAGPFTLSDPNPPATPTATANGPVCAGNTLSLGTSVVSGATYTWSGPNGFSSSQQNPGIPNATTAASGTYNVTVTVSGCASAAGAVAVVVNPTPAMPAATSNSPLCTGDNLTLTASTSYTGSVTWTWSGPNGFASTQQNPTLSGTTTAAGGNYSVAATATTGGCASPFKTVAVVVNPTPVIASAGANNPVNCNTATGNIQLNGLAANTSYAVSYTKNGTPVTATLTAGAGGVVTINNLGSGVYDNIKVTASGCSSNQVGPYTLADPNPPATPVATNNGPVCSGQTLTLNASTATAGAVTWSWSGPNGFSNTSASPSINNVSTAAAGTYSVIATLNGCASAAGSVNVAVNQTPAAPGVSSNSPVCTGTTLNLSSATTFTGPLSYAWTGPNGFASSLQNPFVPNATAAEAGPYQLVITATTGNCASAASTTTVAVNPTPFITGSSNTDPVNCNTATGTITLNGLTANATYTVNYTQNGTPRTAMLTANGSGNLVMPNLTAGTYSAVGASLAGCLSNVVGPFTLTDPNPPAAPVAGSNAPVCSGNLLQLSATTTSTGSLTYTWVGPNNFTSNVQNPTIANATVAASGTYSVSVTLNGCTSPAGTVSAVVNQTPFAPVAGYNGPLCAGSTLSLTASAATAGGMTYSWTGPNGFASNAQNPVLSNATAAANGTYTVTATANQGACPSPATTIQVVVHPELVNVIDTAAQTVCYGQAIVVNGTLATGGNGGYAYQWEQSTDNVNWTPLAGQNGASVTLLPQGSIYLRRKITSGPCQSFSLSVYIAVQPPVTNNTVQQDAAICINTAAATLIGSVPVGANGNYLYQWEKSTDGGATWRAIAGATGKDYSPGVLNVATNYRRVVSTALCSGQFGSTSNPVVITVNPDAAASFLPTDTVKCPPFVITPAVVNLQTSPANKQYIWYANGGQIGTGTVFPGYTIANENDSVVIKLKVISTYGCKDDSLSQKFKTVRKPTPSFTLTDTVGCGPVTVSFTNTSTYLASYNYFWDFGNGQTSPQVQPASVTFAPNPAYGDTTYVVKLRVFSPCDTLTFAKSIRVKSRPKALFTPTKTVGCSPMTVRFKNTSKGINNTYFWDFGDGTTLSTATPDTVLHTFITGVVDTFYVTLKAVNECGADSLTYSLIVAPNTIRLNLAVNGTEHFGCAPHAVAFINNSQGASAFLWNFGDGANTTTAKNADTVRHAYLTPGTYTATVQAVNNCSDTTTAETIVVYPRPRAQFTANTFNVCIGDPVRFVNGSDSATAYLWTFGDGLTSTLNNPSHTYTAAGSYVVTLVSYRNNPSGNVCTDSTKQTVTVAATQPGFFTLSDSASNCAPFTVTMVNKNKPSVSALWDFGDGATAGGDSVVHTYQAAGTYGVKLTVKVPGGCTYISTRTITVAGPKGSLLYNSGYVCYPSAVQLQAVATGATSYDWDFGDGTTLHTTQQTVYHAYTAAGYYVPKVTLNNGSCGVLLKGLDTIKVDKVDGGFRWAQTQVCGATTLTFADTSHVFFGTQNVRWAFGDNTTGTGGNPSHSYAAGGRYTVQMIVLSKSGCADTVSTPVDVTVKSRPVAAISAADTACTRRSIGFAAIVQTVDPINFIQWNVSNGGSGTGARFDYAFTTAGTYTVRLVVGTAAGCYDTAYHTVRINPSPVVTATPSLYLCKGNTVQLNAVGAAAWQWLPLSGLSCYTCAAPVASPVNTTPYVVEGRNSFGCADWDTVVITVIQPLKMTVSPDDSICTGGSVNLSASGASSYDWSPSVGLNNTALSNPTASPTVTTRYRVVGYDGFHCFTDTAYVTVAIGQYPTVNLGPDLTLPAGTLHPLATTLTNGPISNWNWTPATALSCSNCALPVAEIKKDITYSVKVTTAYGCSASDTVNIKVSCAGDQVYVPNAFSPDGDGLNDVFTVRGRGIARVTYFRVFNRWGEMVFEAANFKPNDVKYGWDGKVKGKAGGPDVFVYTWEAVCENGAVFSGKGNVSLIK